MELQIFRYVINNTDGFSNFTPNLLILLEINLLIVVCVYIAAPEVLGVATRNR